MLEKILLGLISMLAVVALVGTFHLGRYAADHQELRAATRYLVWPATTGFPPAQTDRIEKTEDFVVFVDLKTGNRIEMPLCSVHSIEEVGQ